MIARRRPSQPDWMAPARRIGAGILGTYAGYYAWAAYGVRHGLPLDRLAVLIGESWWITLLFAFPLVVLLFPDGLPASRAWRRIVQVFVCLAAIAFACALAPRRNCTARPPCQRSHGQQRPRRQSADDLPANAHWLTIVPKIFDVAVAVMADRRRDLPGDRLPTIARHPPPATQMADGRRPSSACSRSASLPTREPLCNSLAAQIWSQVPWVMRLGPAGQHRRRDPALPALRVGRLVSRTLSYAILTALLVGIFIGLIALTTDTLALSGRVGVAASTLAAAALFNPLRVRIQRLVDRRFNRARYNAEATVAAFTAAAARRRRARRDPRRPA